VQLSGSTCQWHVKQRWYSKLSLGCRSQANADPELVHGVNPAWRQVDRIIAERLGVANGKEVSMMASHASAHSAMRNAHATP
jgi:hypothetical protein